MKTHCHSVRWLALALVATALFGRGAAAQPVAGSIEGGLQDLAQAIVGKSSQNDAAVIAVLPFPNSDGSCSVLGTYLADELIQSMFNVPGSKLRIIERSQLESLLREIKIGEGGLLNPVTTQKLGTLSGVKALVLGTVTVIGDHIRINARLVSTADGQTVSAAAIGIARNGEIDGLLAQSIGASGGICGGSSIGSPDGGSDAPAASTESAAASGNRPASYEGVTFAVQNVSRSSDKKTVSIVLALTDKLKNPILAVMVQPPPSLIDDQADFAEIGQTNGIQVCNNNFADGDWCKKVWPATRWTTLSPGMPTMLLLRFVSQQPVQGNRVSLAASLLLAPVADANPPKSNSSSLISVSLANLPISPSKTVP